MGLKIITNSKSPEPSLQRTPKNSPPRYTNQITSPTRFKLLPTPFDRKTNPKPLSLSPISQLKEEKRFSSLTPNFSPALIKHVCIIDPLINYDLKSKNIQKVKELKLIAKNV